MKRSKLDSRTFLHRFLIFSMRARIAGHVLAANSEVILYTTLQLKWGRTLKMVFYVAIVL